MSFIRPEASAQIMRWREVLIGLALWVPGLWWALTAHGLMAYIGMALVILGATLIAVGWQRGRFRIPGKGPGVVQVTEDQITYFGPLSGGVVALSDLSRLSLDGTGKPAHWVLDQPTQPELFIPTTAEGAEALFEAFSRLPGFKTERMLTQLAAPPPERVLLWSAAPAQPPSRRLN